MEKGHRMRLAADLLLTVLIMGMIYFFSSQSGDSSQMLSDGILAKIKRLICLLPALTGEGAAHDVRKYAHLFEFCMLGISSSLLFAELCCRRRPSLFRVPLLSCVFCFLYACSDELHQSFVPGRSAQLSDVMLDFAGACVGVLIIAVLHLCGRRRKRRTKDE